MFWTACGTLLIAVAAGGAVAPQTTMPDRVTVPLHVVGNRPFVDLTFNAPDGSKRSGRFWLDTGGGAFILSEALARDLGLEWGDLVQEEGRTFARVRTAPQPFLDELPLEIQANRTLVVLGTDNILPESAPGHADGLIPGHVLARYHVVFDYPNRMFTLAKPGILQPEGDRMPMPVSEWMGFPCTVVEVDGESYGFLLDTVASYTMVSEAILKAWGERHPDWSRHDGAVGDAVTLGGQALETIFVPSARWGAHEIREFGVVSQREGVFEQFMSSLMAEPIIGALGGNVLKEFRVELDYANQAVYLSRPGEAGPQPTR